MSASPENPKSQRSLEAIILAAGQGTRMNSDLPKVLHPVAGRPMVDWVIDACESVGCSRIVVVVGHRGELVRQTLAERTGCTFIEQSEQLGTGHAVRQAAPLYERADETTDVLVLCGDGPLIRAETLRILIDTHRRADAAATLATAELGDPSGYGRIVRDAAGRFRHIVEHKEATGEELRIREVNPSYYCFRALPLFETLARITNDNAKGEYYITDVFSLLLASGRSVEVVDAVPPGDVLSINTPDQLGEVDAILRQRLAADGAEQTVEAKR